MKRIAITTSLASVLLLASGGSAQARGHHSRHHQRGKHGGAHIERILPPGGAALNAGASGGPSSGASGDPGLEAGDSTEAAGTVTSFADGVLTITLNDGTVVRGHVTEQTEISCEPAQATAHAASDDGGKDQGSGDESGTSQEQGDEGSGNEDEQDDSNDDSGSAAPASCGPASLTTGAFVREAELRVSSAGSVFIRIELIG
jgi:hypothetical protein